MRLPMEPPTLLPGQTANTRSGLRANRLAADTQRAQEQYYQYKATHPVPRYGYPAPAPLEPGRASTRTALRESQVRATLILTLNPPPSLSLALTPTPTPTPTLGRHPPLRAPLRCPELS